MVGLYRLSQAVHWLRKRFESRAVILMYHRVAEVGSDPWSLCVSPGHFAEQLEVLQKYCRPLGLNLFSQALRSGAVPHRGVVVTFDDGYADNLYHAKPLLERYDTPATVFIAARQIGYNREFWWDELDKLFLQPGRLPEKLCLQINGRSYEWEVGEATVYTEEAYRHERGWRAENGQPGSRHALYYSLWKLLQPLSDLEQRKALDQLVKWAGVEPEARSTHRTLLVKEIELVRQGDLIEIGAHTMTHPFLSAHSLDFQQHEIRRSKTVLEDWVGHRIASFSYPYGDYIPETVALIREAGFTCACTTVSETAWRQSDPFQLPRFEVRDWDGDEFAQRLLKWFHH